MPMPTHSTLYECHYYIEHSYIYDPVYKTAIAIASTALLDIYIYTYILVQN